MLNRLIETYGLSIRGAAAEAGVGSATMERAISGHIPRVTTAVKIAQVFSARDGAKLLKQWGYRQAADGLMAGKITDDPEVANGWRLDTVIGELRTISKLLARIDGRQATADALQNLEVMRLRDKLAALGEEQE